MKYDYILMNPPYDGSLHLKIVEKAIELLKDDNSICVNLSPIGAIQKYYTLGKSSITDYNIFGNTYSVSIIKVSIQEAMKMFSLKSLGQDLGIWVISKGTSDIDTISKILVDNVNLIDRMKSFMISYPNIKDKQVKYSNISTDFPLKFVYGLTLANHGGFGKSCYAPTSINYETAIQPISGNHTVYYCVDSEEHRKIAHKIYTSTILRFYYKNVGMNDTPYEVVADFSMVENPRTHKMGYESDWTNEDLCKVFGITGYKSDDEGEPGSEWETILETMKPYLGVK